MKIRNTAKYRPGLVRMPKWTTTYSLPLARPLGQIGMSGAFQPGADFSPMVGRQKIYLTDAQHMSFIQVDETGTAAAAVTSVGGGGGIGGDGKAPPPFEFVADRPFVYAITETESGAMLFLGIVRNPN